MHSPLRRFLLILSLTLVSYLVGVFVWAAFSIPALDLISSQVVRWLATRVIGDFGALVPHATLLAVAIWAGLLLERADLAAPDSGLHLIKGLLIIALVVSGFHVTHELLIGPGLTLQNRVAVERSRLVGDLRERIEDYTARREFAAAREAVEMLVRVDPSLRVEADRARGFIAGAERDERDRLDSEERTAVSGAGERRTTSRNAAQLLQAAREAYDRSDYVTAHLEARRAFDLDTRNIQAWRLAEEAWDRVAAGSLSDDDRPDLQLRKRRVQQAMRAELYLDAYYRLQAIAVDYPDDPDIVPLMREIVAELEKRVFFLDALDSVPPGSNGPGILFVQETPGGGHELVRVAATIGRPVPAFGVGLEALEIGPENQLVYHLQADSVRFQTSEILLRGIHQTDESRIQSARYLAGQREDALAHTLGLHVSLVNLVAIARGQNSLSELNGFDLYRFVTSAPETATFQPGMQIELLRRLTTPFSLLFSFFVLFALAFRMRRKGESGLGPGGIVSVAFLPLLVAALFALVEYGQALFAVILVLQMGVSLAAVVLLFLQAVFVAIALFIGIRTVT